MMDAKRQLSVLASWKYGMVSMAQEQGKKLTQAYNGLLEYILWCDNKFSLFSTGKITSFTLICGKHSDSLVSQCHLVVKDETKTITKTKQLYIFEKFCFWQLHY